MIVTTMLLVVQSAPAPVRMACIPENAVPPAALSEAVTVRIGDEPTTLFHVRGAALGPEGQIAVGNSGTGAILVFGPDGRLRETWGRAGDGPREFRRLAGLARAGDRDVLATDQVARRVVRFRFGTGHVETVTLRESTNPYAIEPATGSRYLVVQSPAETDLYARPNGRARAPLYITLFDSLGAPIRPIATGLGPDLYKATPPGRGPSMTVAPFARVTYLATNGAGCAYLSDGASRQIQILGEDGSAWGALELPASVERPVTREEWDERLRYMASTAQDPALIPRILSELREALTYYPDRPTLAGLVVDDMGRVWVEAHHLPEADAPGWWVFHALAAAPVWVEAPEGTRRLLDVRGSQAALLEIDEHGVERVVVRIVR